MNFLFANAHELAALMELPYIQRLAYLMGIRPYMDRQTCIVGIKRRISYQSLRETLYIGPIAGVKTGSPSHQQMKRAVKSLERAGLVKIQSTEKHLIVKCVLAELDKPVQKQADPRPTPKSVTIPTFEDAVKPEDCDYIYKKTDTGETPEADPPHKSEVNYIFLLEKFEKFWTSYPQKKSKDKALEAFKKLNPDEALFSDILHALDEQITAYQHSKQSGQWTPPWKFPANWLEQQCWNDESVIAFEELNINEQQQRSKHKKQSLGEALWETCKAGADYFDFDFEDNPEPQSPRNIIPFKNKDDNP